MEFKFDYEHRTVGKVFSGSVIKGIVEVLITFDIRGYGIYN